MALSAAFLAMAGLPAVAGAAVGDVTAYPVGVNGGKGSITAGGDGRLWFGNQDAQSISRIPITGGTPQEFPLPAETGVNGLTTRSDGTVVYASDMGSVNSISSTGVSTKLADIPTGATSFQLAAGPGGDILWTGGFTPAAGLIPASGTPLGDFTAFQNLPNPSAFIGSAVDGAGNFWTGTLGGQLFKISPTAAPSATLSETTGVPVDAGLTLFATGHDGNVWFNTGSGKVGSVSPAGVVTAGIDLTKDGTGVKAGGFGIAAGADGNMWFAVQGNHTTDPTDPTDAEVPGRLVRVTPSGVMTPFSLGSADAHPFQLTSGADGNLWVTDQQNATILKVATGAPAAVAAVPTVSGSPIPGGTLSCGGERFSAWAGKQPTTGSVTWLRDGQAIAGSTARSFTTSSADLGHAISCQVTGQYTVPRVWAPATSSAVAITSNGTPIPTPAPTPTPQATPTPSPTPVVTPTPKPTPVVTPAPSPVVTLAPSPVVPAATLAPGVTGPVPTPTPKANTPQTTTVAQAQIITCKYKKPKGKASKKPIKATCKTVLAPAPAASSRAVKSTIERKGKAHAATVIVGSAALRIVSPRILPKGAFTLKVGKKSWAITIG